MSLPAAPFGARLPGVSPWKPVDRYGAQGFQSAFDQVAEEVPVALTYNGQAYAVMLASPTDLADFALGFSLSEGIIATPAELLDLQLETDLVGISLALRIPPANAAKLAPNARTLAGNSGCGLCGTRQLEDVVRWPPPVHAPVRLSNAALTRALADLKSRQPMFLATGATHAAAWCTPAGEVCLLREDVGRHNALDKLIGALMHAGLRPAEGVLLLTSRASYELVQKAAWVGMGIVVAVSAPTALAIAVADQARVTLLGLARDGHYVAYSHPSRLSDHPAACAE